MKILYVTTISLTINAFLVPHIKALQQAGHQVDIACNVTDAIDEDLVQAGCVVHGLPFQRAVLRRDNFTAFRRLKALVREQGYDVVHTHTPVASACVRLACRSIPQVKVIYTAHGFHFSSGSPLKNWLLYYPVERWLARYTDVLITINNEDFLRAQKSFAAGHIEYLAGVGLDMKALNEGVNDRTRLRCELGVADTAVMLLSVGELNRNKNHETALRAVAELGNPNVCYVICGVGDLADDLMELVRALGIEAQVKFLGFRADVPDICRAADIFVFPSFREGLSVSLMEAMAVGLPVVCSAIRGNIDLIEPGLGGYCVAPNSASEMAAAMAEFVTSAESREAAGIYNRHAVQAFDLQKVIPELLRITNLVFAGAGVQMGQGLPEPSEKGPQ